jgi:hypothetical protein
VVAAVQAVGVPDGGTRVVVVVVVVIAVALLAGLAPHARVLAQEHTHNATMSNKASKQLQIKTRSSAPNLCATAGR